MNLCYNCVLYERILCMYQCISMYACKQNKFPEMDNKIELTIELIGDYVFFPAGLVH